jgi:hypothetical protein
MSSEERQLLRAVRRIVGWIQGDTVSATVQSLAVPPDYAVRQELAQAIEFFDPHSVLETRQRRLRGQVAILDRIAIQV